MSRPRPVVKNEGVRKLLQLAQNSRISLQRSIFHRTNRVLRCFRWNSVTLPNRWLVPGEYRRSLPVAPLIADQRCYGETPAGLPTYPRDWLVAAGERSGKVLKCESWFSGARRVRL